MLPYHGQASAITGHTALRLHEDDDNNSQPDAGDRQRLTPWQRRNEGEQSDELTRLGRFVEADGSRCNVDRDAPGQSSIYIPPGEHYDESYRLATFADYPKNVPMKTTEMAMMGFYFTGFKDRVKCFSCGMCVENFIMGDSAFDHRWHSTDCKMAHGQETTNVPTHMSQLRIMFMQFTGKQTPNLLAVNNFSTPSLPGVPRDVSDVTSNLTRVQLNERLPELTFGNMVDQRHEQWVKSIDLYKEQERRKTFVKWPSYPCPYITGELAKDGFFYLGNLDRVQCFSCSGVLRNWAPGDVVREQHTRHFRQCRMANETDPRNQQMTSNQRHIADEEDRARMTSVMSPANGVEPPDPSPSEQRHLAQYLPCNNAINPHMRSLQRRIETFDRWPRQKTRATPEQMAAAGLFHLGESDKTKCYYCNGGLQNWDWNDEPWTEHAKWFPGCEFVLRSKGVEFVRRLTDMHPNLNRPNIRNGVSFRDIPPLISRSASREGGAENMTPMEIPEAVGGDLQMREPVEVKKERPRDNDGAPKSKNPRNADPEDPTDSSLASSLREMEETLHCRVCKTKRAEAIVLPCAHLCACHDCVASLKKCAVCGYKVQSTMKVFRA